MLELELHRTIDLKKPIFKSDDTEEETIRQIDENRKLSRENYKLKEHNRLLAQKIQQLREKRQPKMDQWQGMTLNVLNFCLDK